MKHLCTCIDVAMKAAPIEKTHTKELMLQSSIIYLFIFTLVTLRALVCVHWVSARKPHISVINLKACLQRASLLPLCRGYAR